MKRMQVLFPDGRYHHVKARRPARDLFDDDDGEKLGFEPAFDPDWEFLYYNGFWRARQRQSR